MNVPPGMTPELADEFMRRLKTGETLRKITSGDKRCGPALVTPQRFKKHCELHPEWAIEALRLAKANEEAAAHVRKTITWRLAIQRSADKRRAAERCKNGHIRRLDNTFYEQHLGYLVRRCKDCLKARRQLRMPSAQQVRTSIASLHEGGTLSSGTSQVQQAMRNFIRANPKIGARLRNLSDKNASAHRSAAQRARRRLSASSLMQNNGEDAYEAVRWATAHVPEDERDDVMSRMFVAIGEGRLRLSEARSRVGEFLKDQRRRPRVYGEARFSLDSPLNDDSGMTWLDTKTDADRLWA
ncbi:hypothetical protein BSZ19_46895 [Bradyrhizobium japonicum]|uniref:Uncharacterized protein n=1 Tax=Bradyrhizobium japonicum TaxID=375 RepID=A0A1Y2J7M9_BRAJP|nr:hypothetical protein [Bradyrhizobium japonicum]OSJ22122.1 hypothetical protein BSZ19_46895 [Bradyrhizobium japonicum]